jgi:glucosyl-3-phosphoglycerate synthase
MSFRPRSWPSANSFAHTQFSAQEIASSRGTTVSVCLPARNEARTIGAIVQSLVALREVSVIDQVVVVDASHDGTAEIARSLGAEVHSQDDLTPELGPALGKGDAMWRALSVLRGEIVCFLDADTERFGDHFVSGLLGPLVFHPAISFVKGFYRRPFKLGTETLPDGGGRVTELMARPLLNLFYPELAGVQQPLAGEIAARRELLERLPFATGYGVDIGLLIDAYREAGLDAIAQVDLDVRQNAHQPLDELGPMAFSVLQAVASRLEREGRLSGPLPGAFLARGQEASPPSPASRDTVERPPISSLRAAA